MRVEFWVFFVLGLFFVPVTIVYAAMGGEPVGIGGMGLAAGLGFMVAFYLRATSRRIDPRPEDDTKASVEDHSGIYGEFTPWSWWPLPLAAAAALVMLGVAVGWWVAVIGVGLGIVALVGWVFEAYRGIHAH